jgi:pantoate--beta-alanine ligase
MHPARDLPTLRRLRSALPGRVALVPTMGALHAGHLALIAAAREAADHVIASVFVNPLQFGEAADLARYPRPEAQDLAMLREAGCDLAWLPGPEAMYPAGFVTAVEVGGPSAGFEGAARPGHFRGVATVCAKLFLQTQADVAVFGEKDWQQLQVVRQMVRDLDLPLVIQGVPTVREADGLALSSRNRFLTAGERATAPLLHATLLALAAELADGREAAAPLAAAEARLRVAGFARDYLALVAGESLAPLARAEAGARLIAAARLGSVRLLDNVSASRAA